VPLFSARNRRTGLEALELQIAARADRYRTNGSTGLIFLPSDEPVVRESNETSSVNPTFALRYEPVKDIAFRLSYGTGFVAPDVSQLASTITADPVTVVDPRRGNTTVTLPFGSVIQGGNADLKPEESKNLSAGFVLTPRFAPGLRFSVDYTRIEKTDNIAAYPTGIQGIVDDEALLPGRVQRGAGLPGDPAGWAGPITFLDTTLLNVAEARVEAFDFQLDYELPTRFGTFGFSTVATRQTHYETRAMSGQPTFENVGLTYFNPLGFSGTAEITWRQRAWSAGWMARYYDDYLTVDPNAVANAATIQLQGNGGRVPSQLYHDVFLSWSFDDAGLADGSLFSGTTVRFNVRNVFDEMPPFDAWFHSLYRGYRSPLGDSLGANWQLAVSKRF
jgi:outer membrane receptor protein involved in Fe transport